ncbi:MAG: hypothetical protein K2I80_07925 [Ruminococcus sp.]|nr:hypothetical protein [Ruminococcus sp.]MDE6848468.1 hypothetical protein [Ruminococcus sp.]
MSENLNNMNNNDNFTNAVSGVERVSKKKGKKIALISGITAVALVGGGVAAYNLSDFVKNQVNLRVMKPENYYAWVTEENSKNFAQSAKESYSKAYDKMQNGQNSNVSLKYVASDDFKDYALSEILGDDYRNYDDDESKMLVDIINNINEVAVGGSANVKGDLLSGNFFASLNGENLISGDIALDYENFDYFMRFPELTEQWLCVETGESMSEYLYMMPSYQDIMKNPTDYISPEQLEDMIIRYTNIWNQSVEDIEIEKKESVDICDITVDYTVLSVELNESDIVNLAENFIEEMKNDDVLKNIAVSLDVCKEEEWVSGLDEILEELSNEDTSNNDVQLTVDTYVDPNGDIRGMRFFVEDEGEIFFAAGKDGDNVRGEFSVSEDNEKLFSAELYADENDNKYNGNIDFTVYNSEETEQISVEFTDYEVVNEENGFFNAGVTLVVPDIDPIAVDFTSDGNSQDISYNINFDGRDYGTVILSVSANDGADVEIPDKNGAFLISPYMDSEPALSDYIPEENMKSFIYDILVKLGFSEEIASDGADDITWKMYDDSDDWETYDSEWGYDDFGGFDEDDAFTYDDTEIVEEATAELNGNVLNPNEEGMFSVGGIDETEQSANE